MGAVEQWKGIAYCAIVQALIVQDARATALGIPPSRCL
jgi:hypothetical protein